jgi:hypothetical protein
MEIKDLKIPPGWNHPNDRIGWFWGGMRVLCQYNIMNDSFMARYDTFDEDVQKNVCFDSNDVYSFSRGNTPINAQEFGWFCMPLAIKAFNTHSAFEGKTAWHQKIDLTGEQQ